MASWVTWYFAFICAFLIIDTPSEADSDIRLTKLSNGLSAPTLKFLYCYSCGYKKTYEDYIHILNQKYPVLLIEGANYDPPGLNLLIARLLGIAKLVLIGLILKGFDIFEYFRVPTPGWWGWCTENKFYSCLMLFFLTNIFEGQLLSSGAFEIFLNDVPVWSKLETGRIPQPAELFQIIDNHMRFTEFGDTTVELKPGFAK